MAKTKASTSENAENQPEESIGDTEVTVCRRRENRRDDSPEAEISEDTGAEAVDETTESAGEEKPKSERRKVQRRRQIDPTTCERDYTSDEIEFMHALDAYKRANGRMFPTCSEILEVVRSLGYERVEFIDEVEGELVDENGQPADVIAVAASDAGEPAAVSPALD